MEGIEAQSGQPAARRESTQYVVRFVAFGFVEKARIRVTDHDRLRGDLDRLQCGAFSTVRHIDDHADAVHFLDHHTAKPRDTAVGRLIATCRKQALVVIRQLHGAHAEIAEHLDETDIVLDRRTVLQSVENRDLADALCAYNVVHRARRHHEIAVALIK